MLGCGSWRKQVEIQTTDATHEAAVEEDLQRVLINNFKETLTLWPSSLTGFARLSIKLTSERLQRVHAY